MKIFRTIIYLSLLTILFILFLNDDQSVDIYNKKNGLNLSEQEKTHNQNDINVSVFSTKKISRKKLLSYQVTPTEKYHLFCQKFAKTRRYIDKNRRKFEIFETMYQSDDNRQLAQKTLLDSEWLNENYPDFSAQMRVFSVDYIYHVARRYDESVLVDIMHTLIKKLSKENTLSRNEGSDLADLISYYVQMNFEQIVENIPGFLVDFNFHHNLKNVFKIGIASAMTYKYSMKEIEETLASVNLLKTL